SNEFYKSDKLDESNKPDRFGEPDKSNEKSQIISEFMAADMKIPELSKNLKDLKEHSEYRYTSKLINTDEIAQQYRKRNNPFDIYGSIPVTIAEIPVNIIGSHGLKKRKFGQESYVTCN
ncbi:20240_t:CDS:2, partial [Racocetra persica]